MAAKKVFITVLDECGGETTRVLTPREAEIAFAMVYPAEDYDGDQEYSREEADVIEQKFTELQEAL